MARLNTDSQPKKQASVLSLLSNHEDVTFSQIAQAQQSVKMLKNETNQTTVALNKLNRLTHDHEFKTIIFIDTIPSLPKFYIKTFLEVFLKRHTDKITGT